MGPEFVSRRAKQQAGAERERGAAADTRASVTVQRALEVGASDDRYEIEADAVADEVVRHLQRTDAASDDAGRRIRRSPAAGRTVTGTGTARIARISRMSQAAPAIGPEGGAVDPSTESRIQAARGSGSRLPDEVGSRMQEAFGADFSRVRVHDGPESHDLNRSIQARAFTTQNDVFLGHGAPSLGSTEGTRLLAHELTHVVQQSGGAQRTIRRVTAPADVPGAIARAKEALEEHKRDRAALMKIVRAGAKSSDRRTKNACEWILDGRTKLYALNATGDRDARIAHLGENPATTETWFPEGNGGPGDLKAAVAEYNPLDLDDQTNVVVDTDDGPSTNGWNGDGYIAVMMRGGQMKEKEVLETLRHEVQHDADKNREKGQNAVAIAGDQQADAADMAKKFEGYKTEYRAYNYEASSYEKLSPTKVVTAYGYKWTERQLAIFRQIHAGYDHTQEYWDDSFGTADWAAANPGRDGPKAPSAKGTYHWPSITAQWKASIEARRQALLDYVNPDDEGFNKWDSIRVDDFYKALDAVPLGTSDSSVKAVNSLMWKTGFLGKKDAYYVLEESPDMRKKMKAHLVGDAYVEVFKGLCEVAGVKKATPTELLGKSPSKEVRDVSDAVDAVPKGTTDAANASVKNLIFKIACLPKKEAKAILKSNPKLLNHIESQLADPALTKVIDSLKTVAG